MSNAFPIESPALLTLLVALSLTNLSHVMRSHLTRRVFRQIIYNALYTDTCCSCRPTTYHVRQARRCFPSSVVPSRTLFGFSREPARKQKPPDYNPGLKEMTQLTQALAKHERPPPRPMLVQAFTTVILDHTTKQITLTEDSDIGLMLKTFRYLKGTQAGEEDLGLSAEEMAHALDVLVNAGPEKPAEAPSLVALARELSEAIERSEEITEESKANCLKSFIAILAARNKPQEARDLLEELWKRDSSIVEPRQWTNIILGFARAEDQCQMIQTIELMKDHGSPYDSGVHQALIMFYTSLKDTAMTKKWYAYGISAGVEPTRKTQMAILRLCSDIGAFDWGEPIMRSYVDRSPINEADRKATWTVILRWAAARAMVSKSLIDY